MKLLIYANDWAPTVGGVQTLVTLLAGGLAGWGRTHGGEQVEVTLATQTPAGTMDDSSLPYRVVRRPGAGELFRLIRLSDAVHIAGPCLLPSAIALLLRKPAVIEHHGYQAVCPNGLLFKEPSRRVCSGHFAERRYSECLRCCSSTMGRTSGLRAVLLTFPRRWLSRRLAVNIMVTDHVGARLNLPRSRTIYHGIEDVPQAGPAESPSASTPLEIAYVGRLVAEKGLPLLLEAAKKLKERGVAFRLSMIGNGPQLQELRQLARDLVLGDLVTFTGDLRGAELETMVNKIAVVVMPSVWEETAGLSAIEQMMRGRAVIVADIGGLGEVVDGAGMKFEPGDVRALVSCIQRLAGDPAFARSLGSAARERAMRFFRHDSMIRAHLALYWEVSIR